jgi:dTDP-4-amino-4,6-dideoxygalactose transaminase
MMTGREIEYITNAHQRRHLSGNGFYTQKVQRSLCNLAGAKKVLLTHSCTSALEMAGLLLDIQPGDEVILPSYTFVSTANAFVLRGAIPVFVDIRSDTLNLDEGLIEEAITRKTKAIVPVHYAGVACEMDTILKIAKSNKLKVIEDAAQGIYSTYKGNYLGSLGDLGAYSFHETKNIISGEGGALLVNDKSLIDAAEVIWEKGTDRSQFLRGEVDKYTWRKWGSSFLPGEMIAAFLCAQLEAGEDITAARLKIWNGYHDRLSQLETLGLLKRPTVPAYAQHNAHMYYILANSATERSRILGGLNSSGINAVSHYVPLHSSEAGRQFGRYIGNMQKTDSLSSRIIRLPLWVGMNSNDLDRIVDALAIILH